MSAVDRGAAGGEPRLWRVNVSELRRRVGERRVLDSSGPIEAVSVGAGGIDGSEVDARLELESVSGGVAVRGEVRTSWSGECRRCLEPIGGELRLEIDEVFEDVPTEGETYPIEGDVIDLQPMLREAAALGLPLAPLCREDCAGPDPAHFPITLPSDESPPDPRWAALDALREN